MRIFKLMTLIVCLLFCFTSYGQTNTKYQSQIKSTEALYKIESTSIGSASMSGYHTMSLKVVLRKWTNLATNAKRFDIVLQGDVASTLEKGDWNYVINSLKYIEKALTDNPEYNVDYAFRTSNGIMFTTKDNVLYAEFPGDTYKDHKITVKDISDLVKALEKAVAQAK